MTKLDRYFYRIGYTNKHLGFPKYASPSEKARLIAKRQAEEDEINEHPESWADLQESNEIERHRDADQ